MANNTFCWVQEATFEHNFIFKKHLSLFWKSLIFWVMFFIAAISKFWVINKTASDMTKIWPHIKFGPLNWASKHWLAVRYIPKTTFLKFRVIFREIILLGRIGGHLMVSGAEYRRGEPQTRPNGNLKQEK